MLRFAVIPLLFTSVLIAQPRTELASPNQQIKIAFNANGQLTYAVTYKGKSLIESSPIRFDLQGAPPLGP